MWNSAPPPPVPLRLKLSQPPRDEYSPDKDADDMLARLKEEVVSAMKACASGFDAEEGVRRQWDECGARVKAMLPDHAPCACVKESFRVLALVALRMYTAAAPCARTEFAVYLVLNRFLRERTVALRDEGVRDQALAKEPFAPWNNFLWFLILGIRAIRYGDEDDKRETGTMPEQVYHGVPADAVSALMNDGNPKLFRSVTSASMDRHKAAEGGRTCVVLKGAGPRLCGVAQVSAHSEEREYLFEPMTLFDSPVDPLKADAVAVPLELTLVERERECQNCWLLDLNEDFMGSLTMESGHESI